MAKWFNIGGPCRAADNYMLSATERLPNVVDLINKKQYFVVHAPRHLRLRWKNDSPCLLLNSKLTWKRKGQS